MASDKLSKKMYLMSIFCKSASPFCNYKIYSVTRMEVINTWRKERYFYANTYSVSVYFLSFLNPDIPCLPTTGNITEYFFFTYVRVFFFLSLFSDNIVVFEQFLRQPTTPDFRENNVIFFLFFKLDKKHHFLTFCSCHGIC